MREHPIPQDITSYKFHIIGNMTLKQFAELAGGCLLALVFYLTNLPGFVKWPLIMGSIGLGVVTAFVPLAERPIDHWLITFIRVLYKPTKFFWKRKPKVPEPFEYHPSGQPQIIPEEVDLSPVKRQRIKEYLSSVEPTSSDQWEQQQNQRIAEIMAGFDQIPIKQSDVKVIRKTQKPLLRVRVRSLKRLPGQRETALFDQDKLLDTAQIIEETVEGGGVKTPLTAAEVAQEVQIPAAEYISVTTEADQQPEPVEVFSADNQAYSTSQADQQQTDQQLQQAALNVNLPFPTRPKEPNKIVGMILTPDNNLVTDAIIEVRDSNGGVVRAVKSNSLGQFFTTTPLPNGTYTLGVEKENLQFQPIQLSLTGEVVDPIEVRSFS